MKFRKDIAVTALIASVTSVLLISPLTYMIGVNAEQGGTSPESGVVSRIGELFGFYEERGQGSDEAGDWGDYGSMWNRIFSNRVDYSLQQYSERDDFAGSYNGGSLPEDYQLEESEWSDESVGGETVWKDKRTGVYWSPDRGVLTSNNFTAISLNTCDYFNEELYPTRAEYPGEGAVDIDCGDAINYCATLDWGGRTDWYLPSQKELIQAYMDGMYNQAGATPEDAAAFTISGSMPNWSSSEVSNGSTYAWYVYLFRGSASFPSKTNNYSVRCVARD